MNNDPQNGKILIISFLLPVPGGLALSALEQIIYGVQRRSSAT